MLSADAARAYARVVGDSDGGSDDDVTSEVEPIISPDADDDIEANAGKHDAGHHARTPAGVGVSHGVYLGAGTGDLRGGSTTASSRALRWLLVCCTELRAAARVWPVIVMIFLPAVSWDDAH